MEQLRFLKEAKFLHQLITLTQSFKSCFTMSIHLNPKARFEAHTAYLAKLHREFINAWNKNLTCTAEPGDFDKIKVIGTGAFGIVYLARHNETGKYYAMKMLEKEKVIAKKQIKHSLYERRILSCLNFPFVVCMQFFFKDNVYLYFVMPYVAGGEMFTYLRKVGKFEEKSSKFYAGQVLLALEYLHACDLVYRDLKPENVMIDQNGYIKLTDFGFCKLLHGRTWTLCGTPEYLAPEIILSKGYGASVDWWALGVLIFEISAGHPPFFSSDPMRIYEKIVAGKYHCPSHFSWEIKELIGRLLQVDLTRRYGNLRDGAMDIKEHKWFREIDFDALLRCRIQPPFIPKIQDAGDTSNFEDYSYEEEKLKESPECLYEEEFSEF